MPNEETPETSEQIFEEIQNATVGEETEEETSEETKGAEEEAEETSEEETEEETEPVEEKEEEPQRYPIRVKGKIEMYTLDELQKYAQQGRFLEQERAKDKAEKKEPDSEELDKAFLADVKTMGYVRAMGKWQTEGYKFLKAQDMEARKEARAIAESSEWGKDPNYWNEFNVMLDEGVDATTAGLQISAKYWKAEAEKGQETGEEKGKRKIAAQIPKGKETAPDARESGTEASSMQEYEAALSSGKPTSELLKIMKKAGVTIAKDTI